MFIRRASTLLRVFSSLSIKPVQFQDSMELQTWLQWKGLKEHHAQQMAHPLFASGYTDPDLLEAASENALQASLSLPLAELLAKVLQKPPVKYTLVGELRTTPARTAGDLLDCLPPDQLPFLVLGPSGQPMSRESPLESSKIYPVVYEHIFLEESKAESKARQEEFKPPDHLIVATESVIKNAMEEVRENINKSSDGDFRVPPAVIVSCARSGKTLTLKQLFNAILKEGKYVPMFVTFNGQSGFKRNPQASDVQDFLRAVITQLGPNTIPPGKEMHTYFSQQRLDGYLKSVGKPVVLLVDELNALTKVPSDELAALLREMFLDPAGRYLCFTSHRGIDLSEKPSRIDELGGDKASPRGRRPIEVARTLDLATLQQMFKNKILNPCEIFLYCGLAGLVYSMKTDYNYHGRFNAKLEPEVLAEHLDAFLHQVRTGDDCCPPDFAEFTVPDKQDKFVWPLCYVEAYLARMGKRGSDLAELGNDLAGLIKVTDHLAKAPSQEVESLVWEYTVRVGLGLAAFSASRGFNITNPILGGLPSHFQLLILYIPAYIHKPEEAQGWIDQQIKIKSIQASVLALAFPMHMKFGRFDGIIRYSAPENSFWRGVQMKLGNDYPEKDCTPDFPGVLVRGDPPETAGNHCRKHWIYLTYPELQASLPYSMWPLIPEVWKPKY